MTVVRRFCEFLVEHERSTDPREIGKWDVEDFMGYVIETRSSSTVNVAYQALQMLKRRGKALGPLIPGLHAHMFRTRQPIGGWWRALPSEENCPYFCTGRAGDDLTKASALCALALVASQWIEDKKHDR